MRRPMPAFSAARCRTALALVALLSGCAQTPPPAAPDDSDDSDDSAMSTSETAGAAPESVDPEPAQAADEPPLSKPATGSPAPAPTAHGPKDARGKEQIQQVMASNREKVRACYDAALAQNPGIQGDLVLDFVIDPRGDVKQAEVNWSESDLHIPELDTCAVDAVRSIKFPASTRGLESKVKYPFNFNPPRPAQPAPREEPAGPAR